MNKEGIRKEEKRRKVGKRVYLQSHGLVLVLIICFALDGINK